MEGPGISNSDLTAIINKYANMIYRLAFNQTRNRADADDLLQEVLIKYMNNHKPFASEEHVKAWFIRVTINSARKIFRTAYFRRTVPLSDHEEMFDSTIGENRDVLEAVLSLPPKYRIVIHLHYYEDLSIAQIGEILTRSETAVKTQLFRARKLLKDKLKGDFGDE